VKKSKLSSFGNEKDALDKPGRVKAKVRRMRGLKKGKK